MTTTKRRRLLLALGLAATLAACSKTEPTESTAPPAPPAIDAQKAYAAAQAGSGFTVGMPMAADPVLVFFDPQCPHCAQLWKASQPLLGQVRMVWMPIAFLRAASAPQGAAILAAQDPAAAMNEHEALLAGGQGGLAVPASPNEALLAKVKANTELLGKLGADSVPFILFRNRRTGAWGSVAGALPTEQLAQALGL